MDNKANDTSRTSSVLGYCKWEWTVGGWRKTRKCKGSTKQCKTDPPLPSGVIPAIGTLYIRLCR
jgi:hypothetical protein